MCKKGIMSSSTNYQKQFNIEGKRKLTGKNIADFIGIADEAFICLGLENYLYMLDDSWEFADNPANNKFTERSKVGKAGSWPQAGLDHFREIFLAVCSECQRETSKEK